MTQHNPGQQTGADLHYQQALAQGQFLIQRCEACSRAVFYPRMICPHCGSDKLAWQAPSGRGTVYSTTVVRRKPDAGGDYNVALVDLEEGVRLMSRVDGVAPADVRIGMPVQAKVQVRDDSGLLVFVAREGQA
ncbi:Zn-ribbon domain-containing OB-fold protein [Achromobacter aloeverae]|uniref:DNA-binding protein n=1 Tax=Achromobacter aloeverae TaxID=1750518 RepID=A0A4Q1HP24_9BURK|nr:Zn-ribbon domain-containing OB-fold protein [Achromobacter aloeverae]RXN92794.1 DNA-binding protein [Achromobacter aloeverae]